MILMMSSADNSGVLYSSRFRCKKYFEARGSIELFSLRGDLEKAEDELRLARRMALLPNSDRTNTPSSTAALPQSA
jgi:hypothetical protein